MSRNRRNNFQPTVMELENRITPSAILPMPPPSTPTDASPTPPVASSLEDELVLAEPQVRMNFSRLPPDGTYEFRVKMKDRAGNTFNQRFWTIGGIDPKQMRDLVHDTMASEGWITTKDGDFGLTIEKKVTAGQTSPISGVEITEVKGLLENQRPGIAGNSGVQLGQVTTGTNWVVAFTPHEDASVIEQDTVVFITVNGTTIHTSLIAGMTPEEVAFALYEEMIANGVGDAVLSGNTIEFLDRFGQEITDVELGYACIGPCDEPEGDLLGLEITVAEREILD